MRDRKETKRTVKEFAKLRDEKKLEHNVND